MSFGFSVSDVTSLVLLTTRTYQGWKGACGEYSKITGKLDMLEVILSRVGFEVQQPSFLLLYHDRDLQNLQKIVSGCKDVVKELENVLSKYKSLGTSRRKNWDRLRLGNKNLSGLQEILGLQITALGTYLSVLGVSSVGRVEGNIKILPEMKRTIDNLAAEIRAGRREGSVMTTYENDKKEVWRQFRRELISEGFRSDKIENVKLHLRSYLRRLNEAGLLDEEVPEELEEPRGIFEEAGRVGGEANGRAVPQATYTRQPDVETYKSESEEETADAWIQGEEPLRPPIVRHASRKLREITYQPIPPASYYPTVPPDDTLPAGWYRLLDPENNFFYVDMCAGRGNKKCFWERPIPEEDPGLPPPLGWQRIQTVCGRIFWIHSSSGMRSYTYPTKNAFIVFRNGEVTHAVAKGFTRPLRISLFAKTQLVLQDEGTACQISRAVWESPLSEEMRSVVGYWQIYLVTSNAVVLIGSDSGEKPREYKLLCQNTQIRLPL